MGMNGNGKALSVSLVLSVMVDMNVSDLSINSIIRKIHCVSRTSQEIIYI